MGRGPHTPAANEEPDWGADSDEEADWVADEDADWAEDANADDEDEDETDWACPCDECQESDPDTAPRATIRSYERAPPSDASRVLGFILIMVLLFLSGIAEMALKAWLGFEPTISDPFVY